MKAHRTMLVTLVLFGALPLLAQNTKVPWWSLDSGASWSSAGNTAVQSSAGQALVGSGSAGNVRIASGFLANPMARGSVSEVEQDVSVPLKYSLSQNYPNPFNPTTTVAYELPAPGHVSLKVYSLLGELVAVLVDEVQVPGRRSVEFDARGLASGVYVYRLTAGSFAASKKLVVLK